MIKRKGIPALILLLLIIPLYLASPAKAVVLAKDTTVKTNLNGDSRQEKVRYTEAITGKKKQKKTSTVSIYINNKLRTTISETAAGQCYAQVFIIDFNKNKPYLDIYVEFHQMDDVFISGHAYRYYSKKKFKVLYETTSSVVSYSARIGKQKRDGTACYTTTYQDPYVGMVDVNKYYSIVTPSLVSTSVPTYNTSKESSGRPYKAKISLDVFKNRTDKTSAFTIKKGDIFTVEKIFATDQFEIDYIFIRTQKGKTGWIPNPHKSFYKKYDSYDEKYVNGIYEW